MQQCFSHEADDCNLVFPSIIDLVVAPFLWLGVIGVEGLVWARVLKLELGNAPRLSFWSNLVSGVLGIAAISVPA